jgi:hypothetical protein
MVLGFLVLLLTHAYAKDAAEDKTIEGTVKAVVEAENNAEGKAKDTSQEKEHVKIEEAAAVAKATSEVLKSEGKTDELTPHKIKFEKETLDKAESTAKETFKELSASGVDTKAAAAAAAETAIASADGAVAEKMEEELGAAAKTGDVSLAKEVKLDAEKAGIAAGKAVADHPHDEALAMADAVKEVQKEETADQADLKKAPKKGLVATAAGAVSDLPSIAEDAVTDGAQTVGNSGLMLMMAVPVAAVGYIAWKKHSDENTPYLKRLRMIREEFSGNGESKAADTDMGASLYTGMQEFPNGFA